MTKKPLKFCGNPLCMKRVSSHKKYYCDDHDKARWLAEAKKGQDLFYNSPGWRRFAKSYRERFPFCRQCSIEGRTSLTEVVDHIVPRSQGGKDYDENNLQPLCHACHNRKRQKERTDIKRNKA